MKKILTAILMLIITVSAASAASYDISEHESLPLSGISRIVFELRSPNCALCISTDRLNYRFTGEQGGDSLNLSLEGNLKSNNKKAVPELITEKSSGTITVRLYPEQNLYFGLIQSGSVFFEAGIPAPFDGDIEIKISSGDTIVQNLSTENLEIRSSSGDIDADALSSGFMEIRASSGDISADRLEASDLNMKVSSGDISIKSADTETCSIDSSSGRINIGRIAASEDVFMEASSGRITAGYIEGGKINIRSHSGDITIDELTAQDAMVKASSGDIDLRLTALHDSLAIESSSGEVDLKLPEDAAFSVSAKASSGKIRSDFAIMGDVSDNDENELSGDVNGGGTPIRIKASSGDISIKK